MDLLARGSFRDRVEAGRRLGEALRGRPLRNPLVLGIPRGGVVVAAALADVLDAELDVVLARKLRAPSNPEYALGAVSEDGRMILNPEAQRWLAVAGEWLETERDYQLGEIARRQRLFRSVRSKAAVAGRSVIVTDDGIATGATMIAALQAVRAEQPGELIAAAPVAAPDRLAEVRCHCDAAVCLLVPSDFTAVGQFYDRFEPVEDEEVVRLLRAAAARLAGRAPGT